MAILREPVLKSQEVETKAQSLINAIKRISGDVDRLESLLDEIDGTNRPTGENIKDKEIISVAGVLQTSPGKIYDLAERIAHVVSKLRESLI